MKIKRKNKIMLGRIAYWVRAKLYNDGKYGVEILLGMPMELHTWSCGGDGEAGEYIMRYLDSEGEHHTVKVHFDSIGEPLMLFTDPRAAQRAAKTLRACLKRDGILKEGVSADE